MKKTIRINLSPSSINDARQELAHMKSWLIEKNEEFVRKLADKGFSIIENQIQIAQGDSDKSHYTHVEINRFQTYAQARLVVEGKDILFIEFGAGVHYNGAAGSSPHPEGVKYGYTIGSYGRGLGKNDYWFYRDGGALQKSYGTQATMPVYTAYKTLADKDTFLRIAEEVFNG